MTLAIPLDTPPPPEQSRQIRQILARARSEGADLWAPRAFQAANQGEMAARQALYSQQRRPPLLRRYAQARSTARNALNLAQTALGEALKNRARARQEAVVGLDRAAEELDSARTRARAVKISADGRTAIKRLEISLSEARRSLAREAFKIAASQASQVEENSRVWLGRSRQLADRLNDTERLARWRRWSAETVEWSAARHAPAIVVDKAQRRLFLYEGGALVETFETDLGLNPLADKATEGDNATPEGKYRVTVIKAPGETRFHRALLLDYPNLEDRKRFRQALMDGTIPKDSRLGGLIEIHGRGGRRRDWTNGCVALSDDGMDFLVRRVRPGTPVTIVGSLERHTELVDGRPAPGKTAR